ncbi:sigma 54-interacting transcriptional regulator [candidate division KSB1 bacterium]|nr:sigma 54-interacting transcriptional regulator [candidate division KSB1 bacterium]
MFAKAMRPFLQNLFIPFTLFAIFAVLTSLPLGLNETLENTFLNLQFKLRGERDLSDDIVLVYLGAEDIQALGGWPITRDYYGYITHALTQYGAKVIGFNLLFDSHDPRFPEYDQILAEFFETSGNVCLPLAFYELNARSNQLMSGVNPIYPIEPLRDKAAAIGFSNLGKSVVIYKVPIWAVSKEDTLAAFGFELARKFMSVSEEQSFSDLPLDASGRIRLNHFGGIDRIASIGFVDLLQAYESSPDSLNLTGKIAIIDVTAPGIPTLEATPFSAALPVSLIHATIAENIIEKNYLRDISLPFSILLIFLSVFGVWILCRSKNLTLSLPSAAGGLVLLWVLAQVLFSYANLVVPLFYPTFAIVSTAAVSLMIQSRQWQKEEVSVRSLLQEQIDNKEGELAEAKSKLEEVQKQLHNESTVSEQSDQLAEERKQTIIGLEKQLDDLRSYQVPDHQQAGMHFSEIIHSDTSPMIEILELVVKVASDDIPVLILGETGTGKEMIAKAIHQSSNRKMAPFVAVNCGALPETLLESELFGHEKGSFTGAQSRRKGRFELADRGTIFLDEITETSARFQAQLLRVLQDNKFERLGGEQTIKVDVRVIAATNKNLLDEAERGPFRNDLFFRLNGFPLTLPPLEERQEDIPLLCKHFLKKHNYDAIEGLSDRAVVALKNYSWPGNIRELENVTRRVAIITQSEKRNLIQLNDLPKEIRDASKPNEANVDYKPLEEQILESLRSLKFSRSSITATAEALGNRDRGTITEYFRGLCFKYLAENNFDLEKAANSLAATEDEETVEKVRSKIADYLNNLYPLPDPIDSENPDSKNLPSQYKGLPKKFHPYLNRIINHLRSETVK